VKNRRYKYFRNGKDISEELKPRTSMDKDNKIEGSRKKI
jgi:hypothetical protein